MDSLLRDHKGFSPLVTIKGLGTTDSERLTGVAGVQAGLAAEMQVVVVPSLSDRSAYPEAGTSPGCFPYPCISLSWQSNNLFHPLLHIHGICLL